jgi:hypothetical protein
MSYTETLECSDMTSEWMGARREAQGSQCLTPRLERHGCLTGGDRRQEGYRVRAARDRRLDVDVASGRALLVRRSCCQNRGGSSQPIRTAHRGAS